MATDLQAQLVKRKVYKLGYWIRTSIVFQIETDASRFSSLAKEEARLRHICIRKDGMTEYTVVVGLEEVNYVLELLYPFLHLKKNWLERF